MATDGVLGVAAIDVIVGDGRGWGESGIPLPSGGRICVIECNPRLNRHNRVGMLVERLSRIWGSSATIWPGHCETVPGAQIVSAR